jgi:hypothetical protein
MRLLEYASGRINSVLNEIDRLEGCEFPYPHSRAALRKLRSSFEDSLRYLRESPEDPESAMDLCATSLRTLFRCLPLLGFILRSTDVRNSFEVVRPLLHISEKLIKPRTGNENTRLILSSEWRYSPIKYHEIPDLPSFVLIGLPAPESENPLLIPLSGHELGHAVWNAYRLKESLKPKFQQEIVNYIMNNQEEYKQAFPSISQINLSTRYLLESARFRTWQHASAWVLEQAKETFCDFIGLRLFGTSFLHAFAYLLAPNVSSPRAVTYPQPLKRVKNLKKAADAYGFDIPDDFEEMFKDRPDPLLAKSEEFQLSVADNILEKKIDVLIEKAQDLIQEANIPKPSVEESQKIYERFELIVPAENCKDLADVLNAAWKAYNAPNLWKKMEKFEKEKEEFEKKKERILKDLVLKTIEVFEVEHLLKGDA